MPRQNRVSGGSRPRMGSLGRVKAGRQIENERFGCPSPAFYFALVFAAQVFRWDSTVDGFLFLVTISSTTGRLCLVIPNFGIGVHLLSPVSLLQTFFAYFDLFIKLFF